MFSPKPFVRYTAFFPGLLIIAFMLLMLTVLFNILIPIFLEATTFLQYFRAVLYIIFYAFCYIMCVWSYFKCVFTHPGPVNTSYLSEYQELYGSQQMRYCSTCESAKPPRCHHCSICKMCVVNMDHHCPWLCNCIGYNNKKFFVLFLFYAFVGCTFITLISGSSLLSFYSISRTARRKIIEKSFTVFSIMIAFSFSITLLFFGGFHFWLVLNDKTTLETDIRSFLRCGFSSQNVPYKRNWCIVMDSNPWIWFIPVHDKDFHFSWDFIEMDSDSDNQMSEEVMQFYYQSDLVRVRDTIPLLVKDIPV